MPSPEFMYRKAETPLIARELQSFQLLLFEKAIGSGTLHLSLKTSPPLAVVGNKVYKLERVRLLNFSSAFIDSIQPDDTRLHKAVCGFNCVYHFEDLTGIYFDTESRPSILGYDNITRVFLSRSKIPLTAAEIANVVVHNAHVDEDTCPICLQEDAGLWRQLMCGHVFHPNCINRWTSINQSCPCCRRGLV